MVIETFMNFLSKVLFFSGYLNNNTFEKPLTREQEAEHIQKFIDGDLQSKEILIKHNLRLVAHVVKKYNGAAEADDLISVGSIGLIKAINTFNPQNGTQLSTYAARCIENEILMLLRVNKKHQSVYSISESLGNERDGSEVTLADIIPDKNNSIENAEHSMIMKKLIKIIKQNLNEREYKIINLRYGIETNINLPQREVAKKLGISRSYISR
ncbi:MAG: sigma-70 family RNA polymerase sigma factor, partial [Firmicutes bacterium]|nr:sigma-70 family RNA polymerase sigma factor [Bacillota bacterium]